METSNWIALVAVILSVIGLIISGRKDTRSDAAANAITQTKLDNLIIGMTDIRGELRSMKESINDHAERLAKVEARLDLLQGKAG